MEPWIDLAHPVTPATPSFPGDPPLATRTLATPAAHGYGLSAWDVTFHAGTHVDAPAHFIEGGRTIQDLPLSAWIGSAIVIPIGPGGGMDGDPGRELAAGNVPGNAPGNVPGNEVGPDVLLRAVGWEACRFVLFRTGWDQQYGTLGYHEGFPQLSDALAARLCEAELTAVGVDAPSLDVPPYPVHTRLLGAGICLFENLRGLEALPAWEPVQLYAVPVAIEAEAMWIRPVAWIPDSFPGSIPDPLKGPE